MKPSALRPVRRPLAAAALLVAAGCGDDGEIRQYTAPRAEAVARQPSVAPPKSAGRSEPTWTLPEGWTQQPGGNEFRFATIKVPDGDKTAELLVSPLPGEAGGHLQNVNRWRGQVKLGPTTEKELDAETKLLDAGPLKARVVDLKGPDQRMLAATLFAGGFSWFFKMTGPPDVVEKNKGKFEAFVASVRFRNSAGGSNGNGK